MADTPDIDSLGIKDLKALIAEAGLSTDDCIDKSDLRARAREAVAAKAQQPKPASAVPAGRSNQRTMAGYECIVKGPDDLLSGRGGAPVDLVVIALHGLGAQNTDLVDIPQLLGAYEPALASARLLEIYPQAPMGPMGAQWWSFDVMSFMQANMTPPGPQREALVAALIRKKPHDLDQCRAAMTRLLAEAVALGGGVPHSRVLLAGFSLGAITSLDNALQRAPGEGVAGVLFMNGAPICVEEWAERMAHHQGLKVHLTAGMRDTTLPSECVGWVKQLLDSKGANTEHQLHPGGHEVGGPDVLRKIARFVASLLPTKS
jgi:predicted esterase